MARRGSYGPRLTGFEVRPALPDPRLYRPSVDLGRILREVQDRRTWHPQRAYRPAVSLSGNRVRLEVSHDRGFGLPAGIRFADAGRVVRCVRRKQRREVIFAFGKAGKGAKARRRRRDRFSSVSC